MNSVPILKCRSCGAGVLWVRTEAGHAMPVDSAPTRGGTIEVINGSARVLSPIEAAIVKGDAGMLYVSHFATCPHAAAHRKKKP